VKKEREREREEREERERRARGERREERGERERDFFVAFKLLALGILRRLCPAVLPGNFKRFTLDVTYIHTQSILIFMYTLMYLFIHSNIRACNPQLMTNVNNYIASVEQDVDIVKV
jgi:hypothetical protein